MVSDSNDDDDYITMTIQRILSNVTGAIGSTPLVELSRLAHHYRLEGRILAKLEYLQPGFSKKDRIAKQIIQDAKFAGQLQEGQTVVELTSGNTGTGLAIVCTVLGHPFVAVMSKGNSPERAKMMKALGARVILVDQAPDSRPGQVSGIDLQLVEDKTVELVHELNAFRADQFVNPANTKAHYEGTGPELWDVSDGSITAFCDFVGTGGSFGGCAKFLKPKGVKCYVVEPKGAAILQKGLHEVTHPNHKIQGGGYVMANLPCIDDDSSESTKNNLIDGYLEIADDEAITATRDLAKYEGIYGGFSAGANVAAAMQLLKTKHIGPKETVAILICDSGLKYLSTDLWEE